MAGLDFTKQNARDRVSRRGVDNIHDDGLPGGLSRPKLRTSKTDQRAAASAAVAAITKEIRCRCGHAASIPVTAKMAGRSFRCTKCGRVCK